MTPDIIAQGLISLLVRRYMGPFWYRRGWLKKTQWLSSEALEKQQLILVKKMVRHAERHVPYYQSIMKARGFTSEDIKSLKDMQLFPILKKKDVLASGESMVSKAYPKPILRHAFTGGTTGTPLHLYRSFFSIENEHAFVRRQWEWAGLGFKDRCAYLKGREIPKGKEYLYDPIMRELHLSTYKLNLESAERYLEILKEFNCKGLIGYPSSVFILAQAKRKMNNELPIKSILLTSETLTPEVKDYIAGAFNVDVYNFYGAAERVCYIFTCERGSHHIQPEYGYTELLPGNGDEKKIVSTGLWNYAMPLIRYDTGDNVIASDHVCDCGRHFPTVKVVSGREGDYIKTPAGKIFGHVILTHIFHVICGIDSFTESQIIHDSVDHLSIKYVSPDELSEEDVKKYIQMLKGHIGEEMGIDFIPVDKIEKTAAGKHKFVVSQV